jgi:hypothetical protein
MWCIIQRGTCPRTSLHHFRRTRWQLKTPPSKRGTSPSPQVREADEKKRPPIKTEPPSFDALIARYYRGVYSLALGITDDPLEAVLLTYDAFNRTRKQLRNHPDEATIVKMLVAAVIQGLNPGGFN